MGFCNAAIYTFRPSKIISVNNQISDACVCHGSAAFPCPEGQM
jgi:hypothetical protein